MAVPDGLSGQLPRGHRRARPTRRRLSSLWRGATTCAGRQKDEALQVDRSVGACGAAAFPDSRLNGACARPAIRAHDQLSMSPPLAHAACSARSPGLCAFGPLLLCSAASSACSAMCYAPSRFVRFRCMSDLLPARKLRGVLSPQRGPMDPTYAPWIQYMLCMSDIPTRTAHRFGYVCDETY